MIELLLFLAVIFVLAYAVLRTLTVFVLWLWDLSKPRPYTDPDALREMKRRNPWGG